MISIPQKTIEIINQSPYLREALSMNLINISSLARKLKPQIEKELLKKCTNASIVMALKRLSVDLRYNNKINYSEYIGDLSLKSNLFEATFKNSGTLLNKINSLLKSTHQYTDVYLSFIKGSWQTSIIVSENLKNFILSEFNSETCESQFTNLSSITIKLINNYIKQPGIIGYILNSLAWNGINIIEVISTMSELTVIIEKTDVEATIKVYNMISS